MFLHGNVQTGQNHVSATVYSHPNRLSKEHNTFSIDQACNNAPERHHCMRYIEKSRHYEKADFKQSQLSERKQPSKLQRCL